MQGNPYWPLNGPSFYSVLRFFGSVLPRCLKSGVGIGSNFAARMASRLQSFGKKQESTRFIGEASRLCWSLRHVQHPIWGDVSHMKAGAVKRRRFFFAEVTLNNTPPSQQLTT